MPISPLWRKVGTTRKVAIVSIVRKKRGVRLTRWASGPRVVSLAFTGIARGTETTLPPAERRVTSFPRQRQTRREAGTQSHGPGRVDDGSRGSPGYRTDQIGTARILGPVYVNRRVGVFLFPGDPLRRQNPSTEKGENHDRVPHRPVPISSHRNGVSSVEYAVLLSLIVAVVFASVQNLGTNANNTVTQADSAFVARGNGSSSGSGSGWLRTAMAEDRAKVKAQRRVRAMAAEATVWLMAGAEAPVTASTVNGTISPGKCPSFFQNVCYKPVGFPKRLRPVVVIEQSRRGPAEQVIGDEESLDGGQSVVRIGAELGHARVSGAPAVQRTRRNVEEVARHGGGPAPAAVQQQQAPAGVG